MPTTAERESARLAWRIGLGRGDPPEPEPEPEAPTAPVLSVESVVGTTVTLSFVVDETIGEGDYRQVQIQADGGDWSSTIVDDTAALTSGEAGASELEIDIPTPDAGTYDVRMRVREGSDGPWSGWSNVAEYVVEESEIAPVFSNLGIAGASNTSGSTYATSGLNIVNASEDLLLAVGITLGQNRTVSSATITPDGGSPINLSSVESGSTGAHIWQGSIPNGTNLTNAVIAVTLGSTTTTDPAISYGTVPAGNLASTTAVDSAFAAATDVAQSVDITTSAGGVIFAVCNTGRLSPGTVDWTGDESFTEGAAEVTHGSRVHSVAHATGTAAATGDSTVTATWGGSSSSINLAAASWA